MRTARTGRELRQVMPFDWPDNKCGDCGEDLSSCTCEGAR